MRKICLLLVLCLVLSACSAFAEQTADVSALIQQARAAMDAGDYETAVPLLQKAADLGDATGQLWLGNCYGEGQGVQQDKKEAVKYYQLAADQGNIAAKYNLAYCYLDGKGVQQDTEKAVELFTSCADQGDAQALYALGYSYFYGDSLEQDYEMIVKKYSMTTAATCQTSLDLREDIERADGIPEFYQWDPRWGYRIYGSDLMGFTGCGPTCLSMVAVYLLGNDYMTPAWVAQFSMDNGYYDYENYSGTFWTLMSSGAEQLGLYSEEVSDGGEKLCLRFGISVFPVGNGAAHQAEFLVAAGLGHAFHFPQNSEFGSE